MDIDKVLNDFIRDSIDNYRGSASVVPDPVEENWVALFQEIMDFKQLPYIILGVQFNEDTVSFDIEYEQKDSET